MVAVLPRPPGRDRPPSAVVDGHHLRRLRPAATARAWPWHGRAVRSLIYEVAGLALEAPDVEVGRRSVHAHLWPAGAVLAAQLAGPLAARLGGRRVLELGCGLAAPGLVAARSGAAVTLTDVEDEALARAERNARRHRLDVTVRRLRWGEPAGDLGAAFDVVLGADVTYDARQRAPLVATIEAVLAPGGVAWLADPERITHRDLRVHTRLAVSVLGRFPTPPGLATSDGSEERDVVLYQLAAAR